MLGTGELIVILGVVLLLFGGKKLPELARSLGLGIKEFKKACSGIDDNEQEKNSSKKASPVTIEIEPDHKDR